MSTNFPAPPTFADPVLVDEATKKAKFNPIWLRWFLDLAQLLTEAGGGSGVFDHDSLSGLQGGSPPNDFYHITGTEHSELVDPKAAHTVYAGPSSGGSAVPAFRLLVAGDLPSGTGTVTSVAFAANPTGIFDVAGSPITSSGTITLSLDNQSANTFLAGPATGAAATPTFRTLVSADIASLGGLTVIITTAALTALGSQGSMTFTNGILTAQTQAT